MVDLSDPSTFTTGIPHGHFRYLRDSDPVSWQAEPQGRGFWAVTRYHDVRAVLADPTTFSSWRGGALLADVPAPLLAKLRENMLNRDPPAHTILRRLVSKTFTPKRLAVLEDRIRGHVRDLVSGALDVETCDVAGKLAGELPLFVICEILGVPPDDRARLFELTRRMLGSQIEDPRDAIADGMAAADILRGYGAELARRKRVEPGPDLMSDLVEADLDSGELQAFFMLLFNAGAETTRALLCFGLDFMADHPAVYATLRSDPSAIPRAIEEILRLDSPVIQFRRTATRACELAGRSIAEGDKVVVYFPSANRDDAVFVDPDRFDLDRSPNDHLAFGHGVHYCLGGPLARLQSKHVFGEIVARCRHVERRGPLVAARSNFVRGVRQLRLHFEPA
jgi:cytochrome P450